MIKLFYKVMFLLLTSGFILSPAFAQNTFRGDFPNIPMRFVDKASLTEDDLKAINIVLVGDYNAPVGRNAIVRDSVYAFSIRESDLATQLLGLGGGDTFEVRLTDSLSNTYDLSASVVSTGLSKMPVVVKVDDPFPLAASLGIGTLTLLVNSTDVGTRDVVLVDFLESNVHANAQSVTSVVLVRNQLDDLYDTFKMVVAGDNFFGKTIPGVGRLFRSTELKHITIGMIPRSNSTKIDTKVLRGNAVAISRFLIKKDAIGGNRVAVISTPYGISLEDVVIP